MQKGVVHNAVEWSIHTFLSHTLQTQTHQYANNKLKNMAKRKVLCAFILTCILVITRESKT